MIVVSSLIERYHGWRHRRRWRSLRAAGMHIGRFVNLPFSTWVDVSHCHLISIGDRCGFGEECLILAHDAQMNEYIDATRIGRVIIHESCHIGSRCVILPGVEIGPRAIVGANSVVSRSIPPDSVASGSPARVICSLPDYLEKHRARLDAGPSWPYLGADARFLTADGRREMRDRLGDRDGYITGGYSAMLKGKGGPQLTGED